MVITGLPRLVSSLRISFCTSRRVLARNSMTALASVHRRSVSAAPHLEPCQSACILSSRITRLCENPHVIHVQALGQAGPGPLSSSAPWSQAGPEPLSSSAPWSTQTTFGAAAGKPSRRWLSPAVPLQYACRMSMKSFGRSLRPLSFLQFMGSCESDYCLWVSRLGQDDYALILVFSTCTRHLLFTRRPFETTTSLLAFFCTLSKAEFRHRSLPP